MHNPLQILTFPNGINIHYLQAIMKLVTVDRITRAKSYHLEKQSQLLTNNFCKFVQHILGNHI